MVKQVVLFMMDCCAMVGKQADQPWSVFLIESRLPSHVSFLERSLPIPGITWTRLTTLKFWNNSHSEICVPTLSFSPERRRAFKASLPIGDISKFLFGNYSSHTFLQFRNGDGKVIMEIHGLPHDTQTNTTSSFLTTSNFYQNAVANLCGWTLSRKPKLRISVATTAADMQEVDQDRPAIEVPLFRGPENTVLRYMELLLRVGIEINKADLDYFLCNAKGHGLNCHSVTATLAVPLVRSHILGKDLNFAAPGIDNDLKSHVPTLEGLRLDEISTPKQIKAAIKDYLKYFGAKPVTWLEHQVSIWTQIMTAARALVTQEPLHNAHILFPRSAGCFSVRASGIPAVI